MERNTVSDLSTHILIEYDGNSATQKSAILKAEDVSYIDLFLGLTDDLRSMFTHHGYQNSHVQFFAKDFSRRLFTELKRTPTATDLPLIRFTKEFYDFFDEPSEYMHHARDIVHVEANKSLYKIRFVQPTILFSYKLGIYQRLLESAVNSSMNEVFTLIENKKAEGEDFRKWADKAETSILNIVNDINIFFNQYDDKVQNWKKVVSDSLTPSDCAEFYEMIVFYHLLAAQMCRYWLELNRHMGYCNNELRLEAHRFYKQFLHISPDTGIIDIVPAPDFPKNAAKLAEARKDFGLRINAGKAVRDDIIEDSINKLLDKKLIRPEDADTVKVLLSEGKCKKKIHWLGSAAVLAWFIKGILEIKMKNGMLLVTLPKGASHIWDDVIHNWFVDKDGNSFKTVTESGTTKDKLKDAHKPSHKGKLQKTINDLIHTFEAYI